MSKPTLRFYLVFDRNGEHPRIRIPGWLCTNTMIRIVMWFGWSTVAEGGVCPVTRKKVLP